MFSKFDIPQKRLHHRSPFCQTLMIKEIGKWAYIICSFKMVKNQAVPLSLECWNCVRWILSNPELSYGCTYCTYMFELPKKKKRPLQVFSIKKASQPLRVFMNYLQTCNVFENKWIWIQSIGYLICSCFGELLGSVSSLSDKMHVRQG